MSISRSPSAVLTALVVAASLTMSGCDSKTDLGSAIDEASATFATLNGGGRSMAPIDVREAKYAEVVSSLKGSLSNGSDGEVAAANVLLAQAYAGQGSIAAERALRVDENVVRLVNRGHLLLDERSEFLARADALKLYDRSETASGPTRRQADLDALADQRAARVSEKADLTRELDANEAKIAEKRNAAANSMNLAQQERERENNLRVAAADEPARSRAELIRQADEFRKKGDAHERRAMEAEAEADRFVPTSTALQIRIDQAQAQIDQLDAAKQTVEERASSLARRAREQEDIARDRANELNAVLAEIEQLRSEQLVPLYDEAVSRMQSAVSTLNSASRALSNHAGVSVGATKLDFAQTAERRASSYERIANLWATPAWQNVRKAFASLK